MVSHFSVFTFVAWDAGATVCHMHLRDQRENMGHLPTCVPSQRFCAFVCVCVHACVCACNGLDLMILRTHFLHFVKVGG